MEQEPLPFGGDEREPVVGGDAGRKKRALRQLGVRLEVKGLRVEVEAGR